MAKTLIPITPEVLDWAITESGFSRAEVAQSAGAVEAELESWLRDEEKPTLSAMRKVAAKLHRQLAVFLLPAPPAAEPVDVSFRHPMGSRERRDLNPTERRFLRRARRLQQAQAWLTSELGWAQPALEHLAMTVSPEDAAAATRERLGVTVDAQSAWPSASAAFDAWRTAVESLGITVVQFAMGEGACRGFSLWDERSPIIAVNTAWRDEARIFTLFHEFGHLLTRTSSACATAPMAPHAGDPTERWCEAFAAAVLIPPDALAAIGRVENLGVASSLARRLRVSVRAMALRLITLGRASWKLYEGIPPASDAKRGGGGGTGRNRAEIRADEYGQRTNELFLAAVGREVISQSQALDYLDIPSQAFEDMFSAAR